MDQPSPGGSRRGRKGKQHRPWPGEALLGFFFGALLWLGLIRLAGNPFNFTYWEELTPAVAALGAALAVTRARWVLTAAAAVVCVPLLLIAVTPVMEGAAQGLVRS